MLKKYGKYLVLGLLLIAMAVSGISAYFTATDTVTNEFKVEQDLDVGEWRGHGCGTGLVAVLHRDLSEGRPTLPVGAQLQRHGLGTGAGELGGTRTGKRMWLELPCPATPHTIQPRCPCHATHQMA